MKFKTAPRSSKETAEAYANQVWNDKEISAVDKFLHQDAVIHSLLGDYHGTKAMKEVVQAWLKGFLIFVLIMISSSVKMILSAFNGKLKELITVSSKAKSLQESQSPTAV